MGTVWRLRMDLKPIGPLEYSLFQTHIMCGIKKEKTLGKDSDIWKSLLPWHNNHDPKAITCVDFGGSYSAGEKVFDIFRNACHRYYMKPGTTIEIESWEDAGGHYMYTVVKA